MKPAPYLDSYAFTLDVERGRTIDDGADLPSSQARRLCDLANVISTLVDSAAESEHKCGIATLAEEYPKESSAKTREREIPVNVFPVSFLVISSSVYETLGLKLFSKRAPDSARSFLQPRAFNES